MNCTTQAAMAKMRNAHCVLISISGVFSVKNKSEIAVMRTALVTMRTTPHFFSFMSDHANLDHTRDISELGDSLRRDLVIEI